MARPRPIFAGMACCLVLALAAVAARALHRAGGARVTVASSASAAANASPLPKITWDLSDGRPLAAVDWPAGTQSDIWYVDGPREIEIVLPAGRRVRYTFAICQVQREGDVVRGISLSAPAQQLEPAYRQAKDLIADWDLGGRDGLDAWYNRRGRDGVGDRDAQGPNWRIDGPRDVYPRYGVAVLSTFRSDVP